VLADAKDDLIKLGYEILEIDFKLSTPSFYEQVSHALKWEEQFGYSIWSGNLNAFEDGLRHFPCPHSDRAVLVFQNFHIEVARDQDYAHTVLDIIEHSARNVLLQGKLLLCLVQTDDNTYSAPVVGGRAANWNRREWSHVDRGF
jgi:hypothetical protein